MLTTNSVLAESMNTQEELLANAYVSPLDLYVHCRPQVLVFMEHNIIEEYIIIYCSPEDEALLKSL